MDHAPIFIALKDQRVIPATLETLADVAPITDLALIGLAPREAATTLAEMPQEEFA